ncbi:ABC1 kinase family protein [Neobacillus dielmonensis]|uniref:ABC1 kinase family protein n=1 Tax=Neobacillus dielmonensis TaxID=1347369 RepID=UPI000694B357|nr:AarF/UbiB family protein [Neobacillus dielmonensis]
MREIVRLMGNRRFRTIFFMFVGFSIQLWWLGKTKKFLHKDAAARKAKAVYIDQARKFTSTAEELGGLMIKLGQFVSSRVDILPKEYTDILSGLQDAVPPVPAESIKKRMEQELSGRVTELFSEFDVSPVAAASLGQVHKAMLTNGETAAVKIMRPGIEDIVALDLATLKVLTALAGRFTKIGNFVDLRDVYDEFEEVASDELDYLTEAKNLQTFQAAFQDFPGVATAAINWELTTSKVLVMEFIDGVKIKEVNKLESSAVNKKKLASILFLAYLKQFLEDGFFHADPHPGNLLVKRDGTLCFIDFGMVGTVSDHMRSNMVKLAMDIYLKDAGGIVDALAQLGFLRKNADRAALKKSVNVVLAGFSEGQFNLETINNEAFLEGMREFLYEQPFQIPSRMTFFGKALMTVISICNGLDPDFDLVASIRPFVEDVVGGETVKPAKKTVVNQVKDTLLKIIPASRKMAHLIDQFESGDIRFQPSKAYEQKMLTQQYRETNKMILAIFGTGLFIAGSQMIQQSYDLGVIMMAFGSILTLLQVIRKKEKKRRRPHAKPPFNPGRS